MVESATEAARPARRRTTRRPAASVQKQASESIYRAWDRFGIAPVLLLGLAWFGHREVVVPLATAYSEMVNRVSENNTLLKTAVEKNDEEDGRRVEMITAAIATIRQIAEENRTLNNRILEGIANADAARRQVHAETRAVLERVEQLMTKGDTK